jgi:hypothetical protein
MMPMQCPKCAHNRSRAPFTNSQLIDQTVRKRVCEACGHVWFTVEVAVPSYAIGWRASNGKPVLRVPMEVQAGHTRIGLSHEEAKDQVAGLQAYNERKSREADARHRVTKCD